MLIDIHEAAHEAFVVDAVSDSKHVADLVDHHTKGRVKDHLPIYLILPSLCELLVPSQEGENAYSCDILGPTIDIVPILTCINIFQSDTKNTISVFWDSFLHKDKEILSQVLGAIIWVPLHHLSILFLKLKNRF